MFRIPEITYPFSIDTIGNMLAAGSELSVHCEAEGCNHWGRVNLVSLGYKLGFDHGCLEADLKRHFYCPKCREAGRPDRTVSFISHALTAQYSEWPRKSSAYLKATRG